MHLAVTGANSSVGRSLLAHVAAGDGVTAVACVRSHAPSQETAKSLPVSERVRTAVVSYRDVAALAASFANADSVVHLAGVLIESPGRSYREANVETTAAVVEAAQRAGVPHLLLVSALGADPGAANAYLRSKGEAETIVAALPAASLIRTPLLLGPGSAGGRALLRAAARRVAPLLGGGRHRVQPLDLDDLSRAILNACRQPPAGVVTHELAGPEALPYRELLRRTAAAMGRSVHIVPVPVSAARLLAGIGHRLTGSGISPAVIDIITASEAVAGNADAALGIELTPLSATMQKLIESA